MVNTSLMCQVKTKDISAQNVLKTLTLTVTLVEVLVKRVLKDSIDQNVMITLIKVRWILVQENVRKCAFHVQVLAMVM